MSVPSNVVVIVVYMYLSKVPSAQFARSPWIHTLRTCLNFVHLYPLCEPRAIVTDHGITILFPEKDKVHLLPFLPKVVIFGLGGRGPYATLVNYSIFAETLDHPFSFNT